MTDALNQMTRQNLRRIRAEPLAAAIMKALRDADVFRDGAERYAIPVIVELLMEQGIEIVSDATRQEFGLPPRGPDGWTAEEIVALEKRRLDLLSAPVFIPPAPAAR